MSNALLEEKRLAPIETDDRLDRIGGLLSRTWAYGTELSYYDLTIICDGNTSGSAARVFDADGALIDVLNVTAFQSASELDAALWRLANPEDVDE